MDASPFIFRYYYAIRPFNTPLGKPVHAVYGFATFLWKLLSRIKPQYAAVAFDESLGTSIREKLYPSYKSNRSHAPEELKWQFRQCQAISHCYGCDVLKSKKVEADDLIYTAKKKLNGIKHLRIVIATTDKDFMQCVDERTYLYNPIKDEVMRKLDVLRLAGVRPDQWIDMMALCGDTVDQVPGVPGIGQKTARKIIHKYGSLSNVIRQLKLRSNYDIQKKSWARRLHDNLYWAKLSKRLVSMMPSSHPMSRQSLRYKGLRKEMTDKLFKRLGFRKSLIKI